MVLKINIFAQLNKWRLEPLHSIIVLHDSSLENILMIMNFDIRNLGPCEFLIIIVVCFAFHKQQSPLTLHYWESPSANRLQASYQCRQTEVSDHPVNLKVTYGQILRSPSLYWFSRSRLPLQLNSYPNSSWYWVDTDPIHRPKIPNPRERNQRRIP